MPVIQRELARSAKGPVNNNEDWWYLCRDTDTGNVFVVHEWAHTDVAKSGKSDVGSTHIELSNFLAETRPTGAQKELRRLIGSLVDAEANTPKP
ncbi:hypothetical protein [Bradyrhizobium diazoefficiens]|uniref:hypothetical protein n=1 Tax=Bradyrhizobium diazoefficiens TaxID=1355477 RepID=UPI00272C2414|nr:hypothetical protein [Bradyrhizobium diazoefficiens]WLA68545.1 hypothetical protein QNN01_18915 [Bradyrhizobium diazoefficiens]